MKRTLQTKTCNSKFACSVTVCFFRVVYFSIVHGLICVYVCLFVYYVCVFVFVFFFPHLSPSPPFPKLTGMKSSVQELEEATRRVKELQVIFHFVKVFFFSKQITTFPSLSNRSMSQTTKTRVFSEKTKFFRARLMILSTRLMLDWKLHDF